MQKTYRVAILGLVHDHVWGILSEFVQTGRVELVAAADPNPDLLERVTREFGVTQTFSSYEELLNTVSVDAATVYVENNRGHEVVAACAKKGVHVISEKPMAATLAQAEAMLASAESAGITLMINWPTAWSPDLMAAIDAVRAGVIGQVYKVRNINSHGGPKEIGCDRHFWEWLHDEEKNGAGALMDYCCYGAALCALLLGKPGKVTGIRGTYVKDYMKVDDNAIILAGYDNAVGVLEASWTEATHLYTQHFYGTKGDLFVQEGKVTLVAPEGTRELEVPDLPEERRNGARYFVHLLDTGGAVEGLCNPMVSRDAQEILEAGKRSADTGATQHLPIQA